MNAKNRTIGLANTTIVDKNEVLSVVYHSTEVVLLNRKTKKITLNTGGHFSNTTKARMNQTSKQFGMGFFVYQKNFNWFVDYLGEILEFKNDSFTINV